MECIELEPIVYIDDFSSGEIVEDEISCLANTGFRKYTDLNNKYNQIYKTLIENGRTSNTLIELKELVKIANNKYFSNITYTHNWEDGVHLGAFFILVVKPLVARIEVFDLYAIKKSDSFISLYARYGDNPQDYYSFLADTLKQLDDSEGGVLYLKIIFEECLRRFNNAYKS